MVMIHGIDIDRKTVEIDKDQVIMPTVKPSKLEVSLTDFAGRFSLGICLPDSSRLHTIQTYEDKKEAREAYEKVLSKLASGNYVLRIYRDGSLVLD